MKIKFLGVGSAFTTPAYYQSNMLITSSSSKMMLLDCGSDIRFSLHAANIEGGDLGRRLNAIYISHLHADHIGGLEWVAFTTYFTPGTNKPKLIMNAESMDELWQHSLQGGLKCIQDKVMHLDDYFDCLPVHKENQFIWENIEFTLLRMPHVMAGTTNHYSYGLMMAEGQNSRKTFITTDTQFQPERLSNISEQVDIIFHDTETSPYPSHVHAHYDELRTLPIEIKQKMWLYHYQPKTDYDPAKDGFRGFVTKGQEFDLG